MKYGTKSPKSSASQHGSPEVVLESPLLPPTPTSPRTNLLIPPIQSLGPPAKFVCPRTRTPATYLIIFVTFLMTVSTLLSITLLISRHTPPLRSYLSSRHVGPSAFHLSIMAMVVTILHLLLAGLQYPSRGLKGTIAATLPTIVAATILLASSLDPSLSLSTGAAAAATIFIPPCTLLLAGALHRLASLFILPAQLTFSTRRGPIGRIFGPPPPPEDVDEAGDRLLRHLAGRRVQIVTTDGVTLDAALFEPRRARADVTAGAVQPPVVIHFNSNNEVWQYKRLDIAPYVDRGYSVLTFNYRGVASSTGRSTRDGIILDGIAAYMYVHTAMQTPSNRIMLTGGSLGGCVAALVAAARPDVAICNDRSFATMGGEILHASPFIFGLSPDKCMSSVLGLFLSVLATFSGWELDARSALMRVKGMRLVQYHINDEMVPEPARMVTVLRGMGPVAMHGIATLEYQTGPFEKDWAGEIDDFQVTHCRPMVDAELQVHFDILEEQFIMP